MSFTNFQFNAKDGDNVHGAANLIKKAPIARALKICDKLLTHMDDKVELFSELGKMFNPSMSAESVQQAIEGSEKFGKRVRVEVFSGAIMLCTPNKAEKQAGSGSGSEEGAEGSGGGDNAPSRANTDSAESDDDHIISFNSEFVTTVNSYDKVERNRCTFLHVIKVLHEVAHTITPHFARRTSAFLTGESRNLDTPEKLGSIWQGQEVIGDAGSAWETVRVGGRVIAGGTKSKPYSAPLKLLVLDDIAVAPKVGNFRSFNISDDFIATKLDQLDAWAHGSPLPDLHVPLSSSSSSSAAGASGAAAGSSEASGAASGAASGSSEASGAASGAAARSSGAGSRATSGATARSSGAGSAASTSAAPSVGSKRRRQALETGGTLPEEEEEDSEDDEGQPPMTQEDYDVLAGLGLALTPAQNKLSKQGRKF